MTLCWRKDPKETGLRRVGAAPRGSSLYLDEEPGYLANTCSYGGDWRQSFKGWYWVVPSNEKFGIDYYNSYPNLFQTEKEAKDAAKKYVQECMKDNTNVTK